jgi:amino acid transporter
MEKNTKLRRTLSLPLLCFYGLGTILGAGIYVLVGEVAGVAGMWAPLAFLTAAVVAGITALSYAELASRIPKSAGEAAYLQKAFGLKLLAGCAGWGVVTTGIVSAATVTRGFVGYLQVFVDLPDTPVIIVTLLAMGGLAVWGVGQSVIAASIVTALEIAGLIFVIAVAGHHLGDVPDRWEELMPPFSLHGWNQILLGGYLAFFAFIGFEDIVNLAEEARQPRHNLPRAILFCLAVSTAFYIIVALIAVLALPPQQLADQKAPLAEMLSQRGDWARVTIGLISMVAVINGALIQIIMASRVVYGMARVSLAPRSLADVHPVTQTPVNSTVLVTAIIIILAVGFPLVGLAKATSTVTLMVFALVNAALWKLKCSKGRGDGSQPVHHYPVWVPVVGLILCLGALIVQFWQVL